MRKQPSCLGNCREHVFIMFIYCGFYDELFWSTKSSCEDIRDCKGYFVLFIFLFCFLVYLLFLVFLFVLFSFGFVFCLPLVLFVFYYDFVLSVIFSFFSSKVYFCSDYMCMSGRWLCILYH